MRPSSWRTTKASPRSSITSAHASGPTRKIGTPALVDDVALLGRERPERLLPLVRRWARRCRAPATAPTPAPSPAGSSERPLRVRRSSAYSAGAPAAAAAASASGAHRRRRGLRRGTRLDGADRARVAVRDDLGASLEVLLERRDERRGHREHDAREHQEELDPDDPAVDPERRGRDRRADVRPEPDQPHHCRDRERDRRELVDTQRTHPADAVRREAPQEMRNTATVGTPIVSTHSRPDVHTDALLSGRNAKRRSLKIEKNDTTNAASHTATSASSRMVNGPDAVQRRLPRLRRFGRPRSRRPGPRCSSVTIILSGRTHAAYFVLILLTAREMPMRSAEALRPEQTLQLAVQIRRHPNGYRHLEHLRRRALVQADCDLRVARDAGAARRPVRARDARWRDARAS